VTVVAQVAVFPAMVATSIRQCENPPATCLATFGAQLPAGIGVPITQPWMSLGTSSLFKLLSRSLLVTDG